MQAQKLSRPERCQQTKERNYRRTLTARYEAEQRAAAWRKLSPQEQLAELDKRPGKSSRQRARILAKVK